MEDGRFRHIVLYWVFMINMSYVANVREGHNRAHVICSTYNLEDVMCAAVVGVALRFRLLTHESQVRIWLKCCLGLLEAFDIID